MKDLSQTQTKTQTKTPLRTLSEFAQERDLPIRYFNGRFNRQDAPKPVFRNMYAVPELENWLNTLQREALARNSPRK